jgi:hypothetical protein
MPLQPLEPASLIVPALALALYFAPTLVVWHRHEPAARIFLFNLVLGWTVVGWVIVMLMAMVPPTPKPEPEPEPEPEPNWAEPEPRAEAEVIPLRRRR